MEIISPKTDFCAKELFANEIIRKYFISDVIGIRVEDIRSIRLCNPYLWKRYRKQKQGILNFNYTEDPAYHSVYYLRDENGRMFSDLFEVHIIELRKTLDGVDSIDDWIRFFNARTEEELDMIQTKNIGIHTAIEEVKKMSMSERMRARYEAHMKEVRDRKAIEVYKREQGYGQGYEQGTTNGIKQEKEQIIERMLQRNKPLEEIAELCDCDQQEILAVREKMR